MSDSSLVQQGSQAQRTLCEELLTHAGVNNEQLQGCVIDLRSFLDRIMGGSPDQPPSSAEVEVTRDGVLGSVEETLRDQTRMLGELRECVSGVEKLA